MPEGTMERTQKIKVRRRDPASEEVEEKGREMKKMVKTYMYHPGSAMNMF